MKKGFHLSSECSPGWAIPAAVLLAFGAIMIGARGGEVPSITTEELAALLQNGPAPLLIDVREVEEYAVSRIPGALRAGDAKLEKVLAARDHSKNAPIVVYCSVGVRSAKHGSRLQQEKGFRNVRNLEGSLFAWANENRPMENSAGPTRYAHPFDRLWGRFLKRELWRWKPEDEADRGPDSHYQ